MRLNAVLFDFDGVLSQDRFYSTLSKDYPQVCEFVNDVIFKGEQKYADRWMRGEFTYKQINQIIADATRVSFDTINSLFIESVKSFRIEKELIDFAKELSNRGTPIALVTNNMDIFNEVTVPTHQLNDIFPVIVNSSDHGSMKHENDGKLFDITLLQFRIKSYDGVFLIDDSEKACAMFESKGGFAHRYKNLENFRKWRSSVES